MRWVSYVSPLDGREHAGIVVGDEVYGFGDPVTLLDILAVGGSALADAGAVARGHPAEVLAVDEVALRAPIAVPPSIRDFMAFENHVVTSMAAIGASVDPVWYQQPVFYFTNPAAVLGPGEDVPVAPGSVMFDYELEVAAIIGTECRDLEPATAERHIAGYTIFCDWSARDLQGVEMRVGLGPAKGKDNATTMGPWLLTPDEIEDTRSGNGFALAMTATVNGTAYSSGNLADLYWSFGEMLAYASRGTRLMPGDVIACGTVGTGCILELARVHGSDKYPWLKPGDEVRLDVERMGTLSATIVPGAPVIPLRP